jgi:hypothetical protein
MSAKNPGMVNDNPRLTVQQDLQPGDKPSRAKKKEIGRIQTESDPSLTKELILRLVELLKQV